MIIFVVVVRNLFFHVYPTSTYGQTNKLLPFFFKSIQTLNRQSRFYHFIILSDLLIEFQVFARAAFEREHARL